MKPQYFKVCKWNALERDVYLFDHHEHYRIYFSNKSYLPFITKFTEMEKPVILMNVKWIIWINDSKLIIIFVILEIYM